MPRLSLWQATLLAIIGAMLCTVAYIYLARDLRQHDRQFVHAKLAEYRTLYGSGGVPSLQARLATQENAETESLFIKAVSPRGDLKFFHCPRADQNSLVQAGTGLKPDADWVALPAAQENWVWVIGRTQLSDGSIMLIGHTTHDRDLILRNFRNVFKCIALPLFIFGACGCVVGVYRSSGRSEDGRSPRAETKSGSSIIGPSHS